MCLISEPQELCQNQLVTDNHNINNIHHISSYIKCLPITDNHNNISNNTCHPIQSRRHIRHNRCINKAKQYLVHNFLNFLANNPSTSPNSIFRFLWLTLQHTHNATRLHKSKHCYDDRTNIQSKRQSNGNGDDGHPLGRRWWWSSARSLMARTESILCVTPL